VQADVKDLPATTRFLHCGRSPYVPDTYSNIHHHGEACLNRRHARCVPMFCRLFPHRTQCGSG